MGKPKTKKILFLGQLPPPWHGVSAINSWLLNSKQLTKYYSFYPINITTAKTISDIGKKSWIKYFSFLKILSFTIYKLIKHNPDASYITLTPTGSAFYKDSIILFLLKLFRKPIIVHLHGKGITEWVNSKPKFVNYYYKRILKNTNVIVLGEYLQNDLKSVYNHRPFIVPNGIPLIIKSRKSKIQAPYLEVIFLSNLMKAKGILDFIESLNFLKMRGREFKAKIIGDSGDLSIDYIKQEIISRYLQNDVEVSGPLYGIEKQECLINADVLVFPSHYESFGLVILEAMQAGLSIIATNEGCVSEILEDGENGFIIEKSNPKSITDALEKLILNPTLRRNFGEKNRAKFISNYTLDVFENNILKVLNQIIS